MLHIISLFVSSLVPRHKSEKDGPRLDHHSWTIVIWNIRILFIWDILILLHPFTCLLMSCPTTCNTTYFNHLSHPNPVINMFHPFSSDTVFHLIIRRVVNLNWTMQVSILAGGSTLVAYIVGRRMIFRKLNKSFGTNLANLWPRMFCSDDL